MNAVVTPLNADSRSVNAQKGSLLRTSVSLPERQEPTRESITSHD